MNSYLYRDGSGNPGASDDGEPPLVLAFLDDAATARLLASLYRERGFAPPDIHEGGLGAAIESPELDDSIDLLIVDVDSTLLPIADIGALRTVLSDRVRIAALGSNEDPDYARELIAAGASIYQVKPLSRARMEVLVFGRRRPVTTPEPEIELAPKQRVTERQIVVLGARGGLGATSVAINLASVLAERTRAPALLLDLDLQFGTALLSLNLHPTEALGQMLRNPRRIDHILVRHSMQEVGRYLSVLGAEETLEEPPAIDPQAMPVLMNEICATYKRVVTDLPAHRLDLLVPALAEATDVVLVGDLSLAGVRDTLRMLGQVQQHAPGTAARHVVIGGAADIRHASMTQRQFEDSIGQPLAAVLPHEPGPLSEASAAGRAVVVAKPGTRIAKAYGRLAETFLPAERKAGRGLFGLRGHQGVRAAG